MSMRTPAPTLNDPARATASPWARWAALIAAVLLAFAPAAWAQAEGEELDRAEAVRRAKVLSGEGAAHFKANRFDRALEKFEEANRLVPHPNLEINIGRSHEKLNQPEQAMVHCRIALQAPESPAATREAARECVARLEPLLQPPLWTIKTVPEGAEVRIDGQLLGVTPWVGPVQPGRRQVDFNLTGFSPASRTVMSVRGQEDKLSVVLSHDKVGGILALDSLPAGASVKLNGEFIGTTPITGFTMVAGKAQVEFSLPGYEPQRLTLNVADGGLVQRTVTMLTRDDMIAQASRPQWPAWALIGTAAVTGGVGAIFGVTALSARQDADKLARTSTADADRLRYDTLVSDMETYRTVSDVMFVTCGVTLVGGLVWLLWPESKSDRPRTTDSTGVTPSVGPNGFTLTF